MSKLIVILFICSLTTLSLCEERTEDVIEMQKLIHDFIMENPDRRVNPSVFHKPIKMGSITDINVVKNGYDDKKYPKYRVTLTLNDVEMYYKEHVIKTDIKNKLFIIFIFRKDNEVTVSYESAQVEFQLKYYTTS